MEAEELGKELDEAEEKERELNTDIAKRSRELQEVRNV